MERPGLPPRSRFIISDPLHRFPTAYQNPHRRSTRQSLLLRRKKGKINPRKGMQIRFHRVNLSERDRRSSLQSQTEAKSGWRTRMEIDMLNDEQARESACKEREIQPNYIHSLRKKKKEKPCLPEGRAKEPP